MGYNSAFKGLIRLSDAEFRL